MIELIGIMTICNEKILRLLADNIVGIDKLPQGITNDNYRCTIDNGQSYVIRIPGKGSKYLVNRVHEQKVLHKIKKININVDMIYFEVRSGVMITKFVEGSMSLSGTRAQMVETGVIMLTRIHESKIQFSNEFDFWSQIESYLEVCSRFCISIESKLIDMLDQLRIAAKFIIPEKPVICPCHNDPVPENFLTTNKGEVFLIDWEYAGMNDPVWDLAAFSMELGLDKTEETTLLSHYYGTKPIFSGIDQRVLLYKIYQDFLWFVWSKIKLFFGQDILEYANMRYMRGLKNYGALIA